eukprot:FR742863.1.p2 GENE.FR742863.1~~FR742863.1.p2  ORF type:complete len:138 (+),score=21.79 FR742863.1:429-842(+)
MQTSLCFLSMDNKVFAASLAGLNEKHCIPVPRLQYGAAGHIHPPNGLIIENYLERAPDTSFKAKKLPKIAGETCAPPTGGRRVGSFTNMRNTPWARKPRKNKGPNAWFLDGPRKKKKAPSSSNPISAAPSKTFPRQD